MAFLYLSPSTQEYNPYVNGGNEEYYMNLLADELEPYLHASGISFTRNTPSMTAATSIAASNAGDYDLHLALHSNATAGDQAGIDALEQKLLAQNAQFKNWTCSEEMMKRTKDGKALYLHCLPADITGASCKEGEVDASVFDRYLVPLYKEASFKPYIIAAMILMSQVKDPVSCLRALDGANDSRKRF